VSAPKPARAAAFPTDEAGWSKVVEGLNAEHGSKMNPKNWGVFLHSIVTGENTDTQVSHFSGNPGMGEAVQMALDAKAGTKAPKPVNTMTDDELMAELEAPIAKPATKPEFNGVAAKYWNAEADKMTNLALAGDMAGLENAHLKPDGKTPKWKPGKDGGPSGHDAQKFQAYQQDLIHDLQAEKAEKATVATKAAVEEAVALSHPVVHPPQPGDAAKGSLPAPPDFEAAKLPADNTNAGTHNGKVEDIEQAMMTGKANDILAMKFGTNTYAKKQVKLANNALAAMGVAHTVSEGQKANSHPALTGGVPADVAMAVAQNDGLKVSPATFVPKPAAKAIVPHLSDDKLPQQIDYLNAKGPGQGLSSFAWVNQQNAELQAKLVSMAKSGDYAGIKAMTYPELDTKTGVPTGQMLPISQHKAKGIQAFQEGALAEMDAILHPPVPLKEYEAQTAGSIAAISKMFEAKPMQGLHQNAKANEKLGYYVTLGMAKPVEAITPKNIAPIPQASVDQMHALYKKMDPLGKQFVSFVQSSSHTSAHKDAYKDGKESYNGYKLADLAAAAEKNATTKTAGTVIYKWIDSSAVDTLMKAAPGTILQSAPPMCASWHPTATKGFGNSLIEIVHAAGAKSIDSWGSGQYQSEKEVTVLPNSRFILLSSGEGGPNGAKKHARLLMLPPDPVSYKAAA
jgi:hypothetical protein